MKAMTVSSNAFTSSLTLLKLPLAIVSLVALLLTSLQAQAADPQIFSTKAGALRGYDVISYYDIAAGEKPLAGSNAHTVVYKGATFKFANAENKARFEKNPDAYIPQYGGYCAYATARDFITYSRPNAWKIVDGKLYLNNNKASFKGWQKKQDQYISEADGNWPEVLKHCEKKKRCRKI